MENTRWLPKKKLNPELPHDPAILLLGRYSKEAYIPMKLIVLLGDEDITQTLI